ncbi:hypothetical protein ACP4OV_016620 [Aristida adscensionis]
MDHMREMECEQGDSNNKSKCQVTDSMVDLVKAAQNDTYKGMDQVGQVHIQRLLEITAERNTYLHIACICGNRRFCEAVMARDDTWELLSAINNDAETPLLTAVMSGHHQLAIGSLLQRYTRPELNVALLQRDRNGDNVLHHAIRGCHADLAVMLIDMMPALSTYVNDYNESPMFLSVLRGFGVDFVTRLLRIDGSAHSGPSRHNALHAAVKYGRTAIMNNRPAMATEENSHNQTPMHLAAALGGKETLIAMLEKDRSLGYTISTTGDPILMQAAIRGHVDVARELLQRCPDAPYRNHNTGMTCLHEAVNTSHIQFVKFILEEKWLRRLINMKDGQGNSALHLAVGQSNSEMVSVLLGHRPSWLSRQLPSRLMDVTAMNKGGAAAIWGLHSAISGGNLELTSWYQICALMKKADRQAKDIDMLYSELNKRITDKTRNDRMSLTRSYIKEVSVVATLVAAITFGAAFSLPGNSNTGSHAFRAFLIFDTLALSSSICVAFICIMAGRIDYKILDKTAFIMRIIMFIACLATISAFASGLYTILDSRLHRWAIAVCVLSGLSFIFTLVQFYEWIKLEIKFRKGGSQTFLMV